MKDHSVQSKTIEWLRFFCIAAVVLLHALGKPLEGNDIIAYQYGVYDTVRILFSEGLCTVAVPIFFLISGYLFFVKLEEWNTDIWGGKLKRRAKTLLLPYFLWNLISIAFALAILYAKHYFTGCEAPNLTDWFSGYGWLRIFWDGRDGLYPHNFPLWFIRDLIVFVILTPVFYYFVKKTGIVGIILLYLAYVYFIGIKVPGFSAEGMFYFALGAYLSTHKIDFTAFCRKHLIVASCIAVPLLLAMVFTFGNNDTAWEHLRRLFTLFGSAATIGIVVMLFQKNKTRVRPILSQSSFFVYAAHGTIALPYISKALERILPNNQFWLIIQYFSATLLTVTVLVLCYYLFRKWIPKTTAVLTGGRSS